MNFANTLKKSLMLLEQYNIPYAIAGGLAANLYRSELRLTADLDIAVMADISMLKKLSKILAELDLATGQVKEGDLKKIPFRRKKSKTVVQIIVGRNTSNSQSIGVDFLLMTLPWVTNAIKRAQFNKIKIFEHICPCLTIEDLFLAKLHALKNDKRFKDLDDVEQLLTKQKEFDLAYLTGRMLELQLPIPAEIIKRIRIIPEIGRVSREIVRAGTIVKG
jgi:predicted nucleotidyltransferase component of viral defense system